MGKLSQARKWAHMTQKEVAKRLDLAVATVSRWERGERQPTIREYRRLAVLYRIPFEDIYEEPADAAKRRHTSKLLCDPKKRLPGVIYHPDMPVMPPGFISIAEIQSRLNLRPTSAYAMVKRPGFPDKHKFGEHGRRAGWNEEEFEAWLVEYYKLL